jgi:type IV pilus assembly protein PilQ
MISTDLIQYICELLSSIQAYLPIKKKSGIMKIPNIYTFITLLFFCSQVIWCQENRIAQIKNNLDAIVLDAPGLTQKVNVNIKETNLAYFLMAVSEIHKVNISTSPQLNNINIINNFSDVTVADLLLFLCKEYQLSIDFTGNILSIKPFEKPTEPIKLKEILVNYDSENSLISLDLNNDKLYDVFKKITDVTGKNLVFSPGLENQTLNAYIKDMPLDAALNKIAFGNNLQVNKTRDNFYLFSRGDESPTQNNSTLDNSGSIKQQRPIKSRKSNFYFTILDKENKLLDIDVENTPIANIISDIGTELDINIFISTPLESAGSTTVKAKNISFDDLLNKIFDSSSSVSPKSTPVSNTTSNNTYAENSATVGGSSVDGFTFIKKNNIYFFGTKNQLSVRTTRSIALQHRSIEILNDPSSGGRSVGRINNQSNNYVNFSGLNTLDNNNIGSTTTNRQNTNQSNTTNNSLTGSSSSTAMGNSVLGIIPDEIKRDLDIKIDYELNSFVVNGPSATVDKFESFIKYLDKPVPVILIEVMLLEINRNATTEIGISAGIGDKPTKTQGSVFSSTNIDLSSTTVNKIINKFDGFGSLNIGQVIPEFYMKIKAMESNGDLKIRSSPRLSTLNGHRANLSIGETTYYVVTNQNIYGSQIPQTNQIRNFQPIDAELSVSIKPLVSGDGQITMDIKVIQSSFSGRSEVDAPPGINSREFTSIIRVKDQDIIVLGGLEEKVKNDNGSGTPLLARIPIIKWFFSMRKREDSRKKLTVLIKPTVIY